MPAHTHTSHLLTGWPFTTIKGTEGNKDHKATTWTERSPPSAGRCRPPSAPPPPLGPPSLWSYWPGGGSGSSSCRSPGCSVCTSLPLLCHQEMWCSHSRDVCCWATPPRTAARRTAGSRRSLSACRSSTPRSRFLLQWRPRRHQRRPALCLHLRGWKGERVHRFGWCVQTTVLHPTCNFEKN